MPVPVTLEAAVEEKVPDSSTTSQKSPAVLSMSVTVNARLDTLTGLPSAPVNAKVYAQGLLPNYGECLAFAESLRRA